MKTKRPLIAARRIADELIAELAPLCERIEVAGSTRRGKAEVGDIEVVAIPSYAADLFGNVGDRMLLDSWVTSLPKLPTKNGPKYKQFEWRGTQIDLFLATPENWGLILLIRTGPADFSKAMVTPRNQGGFMPNEMKVWGGHVWGKFFKQGAEYTVPEEADLFRLWQMEYLGPTEREEAVFKPADMRAMFGASHD